MVRIRVRYEGDLRCAATHEPSGAILATDAPKDNEGRGAAFSPTDLLATSLLTCMLTIMGIYAKRHGFDITGLEAHVDKVMSEDPPRRVSKLLLSIRLPSGLAPRQINGLRKSAETCPVHMSLHPDIQLDVDFTTLD